MQDQIGDVFENRDRLIETLNKQVDFAFEHRELHTFNPAKRATEECLAEAKAATEAMSKGLPWNMEFGESCVVVDDSHMYKLLLDIAGRKLVEFGGPQYEESIQAQNNGYLSHEWDHGVKALDHGVKGRYGVRFFEDRLTHFVNYIPTFSIISNDVGLVREIARGSKDLSAGDEILSSGEKTI